MPCQSATPSRGASGRRKTHPRRPQAAEPPHPDVAAVPVFSRCLPFTENDAVGLCNVDFSPELRYLKKNGIAGPPEGKGGIRPVDPLPPSPAYATAGQSQPLGKAFVDRERPLRLDQAIPAACRKCVRKIQYTLQPLCPIPEKTTFQVGVGFKRRYAQPHKQGAYPASPVSRNGFGISPLFHQSGIAEPAIHQPPRPPFEKRERFPQQVRDAPVVEY